METLPKVNHAELRTNQASIIASLIAAFVLDTEIAVLFVAIAMSIGTIRRSTAFRPIYLLLERSRLIRPDQIFDHPEPHRFAQGLGAFFLMLSASSLILGSQMIGWILTWLVVGLAGLNLFAGFCVGCAMYYWMNRLGVTGFTKSPPPGALPGRKPPA